MSGTLVKWQEVADDLLSVVLVKPTAWLTALEKDVDVEDLPPGNWRDVYEAVITLRGKRTKDGKSAANGIITDAEIAAQCGSKVTAEWVAARMSFCDELRISKFNTTCELVKKYAEGHRMVEAVRLRLPELQSAVNAGEDPSDIADQIVTALTRAQKVKETKLLTAGALADLVREQGERDPLRGMGTGIWAIERWAVGGFRPGELVALVAPYKGRKTSTLAHVILHVTRREKKSVTFVSLDESREAFIYRLMAALMAEYAWQHHAQMWNARDENGRPLNVFDGEIIRSAGKLWRRWDERFRNAREWALGELAAIGERLRIYDASTGASHPRRLRAIVRYDKQRYGLDMLAFDHVQRFTGWQTTYERVENGSALLHDLAGEYGMVVWALSQRNQESIRSGYGGYSAGTKGGGGLEANADAVFTLAYGELSKVPDPRYLRIELKHARRMQAPLGAYVEIHPPSGFILPREPDRRELEAARDTAIANRTIGRE